MHYRFGFWTFWVVVNAIASFVWGAVLHNNILGMLVGIACFVVVYTLLDSYLLKHHRKAHKALITGVYIKAGLQLFNIAIFSNLNIPMIPEVIAGILTLTILEPIINSDQQPFLFALLATLLTGFFLSLMVGVISLIVGFIQSKRLSKPL